MPSSFEFVVRVWLWLLCFRCAIVQMLGFAHQGNFADIAGMSVNYYDVLKQAQQHLQLKASTQAASVPTAVKREYDSYGRQC